ncbi:MAG: DUF721 domain-containing protein [Pyrinomonadaceae bacterium]|jgi:hypothetical protein|nr:DUF721 domain-containing protein [Pyrinomonadaceae bacterium]
MNDLIRALPGILRAAGDVHEVAEAAAAVAWRRVSGEGLRGKAVPFRLYRKTLIVAVPDATWQKQLELESSQLLFRLNSMLGQAVVTFIEFRVDPQTVRAERARMIVPEVKSEEREARALRCADALDKAAAEIKDEHLRHSFLLAAGSCIAAREGK